MILRGALSFSEHDKSRILVTVDTYILRMTLISFQVGDGMHSSADKKIALNYIRLTRRAIRQSNVEFWT